MKEMEYLDLQILKRCCRADAKRMDELETEVVNDILVKFLVLDLNVSKIMQSLFNSGYINENVYKNIKRHLDKKTFRNEITINRRILLYITSKISFVALLWSLSKCGYHRYANLLLSALERRRYSAISSHVSKTPVKRCPAIYMLVKQLKSVSDSKVIPNPVAFIRQLAMHFRERFVEESDISKKAKIADRYFAVLSVEIDNFSFMKNAFVSVKSLIHEVRRIIPFTTNPVINEALLNGRICEITALDGKIPDAVSFIKDVMTIILHTEICPESANIYYLYLNVLLLNYEENPTDEKKTHYLEIGYNGLRMIHVLQEDMLANWRVYFLLRMIFCSLDLSISGRPIYFKPNNIEMNTLQYLLSEIENMVDLYGKRRKMMYLLAVGRVLHLKGEINEALVHLKESMDLALTGDFVEWKNISTYMKSISEYESDIQS